MRKNGAPKRLQTPRCPEGILSRLAGLVPPDRVGVQMQGEAVRHAQAVPEAPLSGKQMRHSAKNCNICAKIKSFLYTIWSAVLLPSPTPAVKSCRAAGAICWQPLPTWAASASGWCCNTVLCSVPAWPSTPIRRSAASCCLLWCPLWPLLPALRNICTKRPAVCM